MNAAPAPPLRSWLYVPAHRPDLVEKALAGDADAVVVDLEDGVPAARKQEARAVASELLATPSAKPVWVRLNAASSEQFEADAVAVGLPGLAGVRLPKAESSEQITQVAARLSGAGLEPHMQCLIESALGLERVDELARHPAVVGIGLGEADLQADLGVTSPEGLLYARSRCVVAARAAGLAPPVQSVFTNVRDTAGLRASCLEGRGLGFFGRSAIHPEQVAVINEVFTPTGDEVERARGLVDALRQAEEGGAGALALPDGRFVDRAVVESARRTLALAERLEAGARQ